MEVISELAPSVFEPIHFRLAVEESKSSKVGFIMVPTRKESELRWAASSSWGSAEKRTKLAASFAPIPPSRRLDTETDLLQIEEESLFELNPSVLPTMTGNVVQSPSSSKGSSQSSPDSPMLVVPQGRKMRPANMMMLASDVESMNRSE